MNVTQARTDGLTCESCRFFRPHERGHGTCHRYPPAFAGDGSPREEHRWRFPVVGVHGWCGEFDAEAAGPAA